MPQMAPMNWLFLYFMFTLIFLFINFLNYYMFLIENSKESTSNNFLIKISNWKW
uniref:ATP synthase complex subunit 8 n=1 Tax=Lebia chlorocephala TaxID=1553515 RepID=A0A343C339_9CARA|nr:ATP synthase F0 subunit 8 [Lebia chlorocephala]